MTVSEEPHFQGSYLKLVAETLKGDPSAGPCYSLSNYGAEVLFLVSNGMCMLSINFVCCSHDVVKLSLSYHLLHTNRNVATISDWRNLVSYRRNFIVL